MPFLGRSLHRGGRQWFVGVRWSLGQRLGTGGWRGGEFFGTCWDISVIGLNLGSELGSLVSVFLGKNVGCTGFDPTGYKDGCVGCRLVECV